MRIIDSLKTNLGDNIRSVLKLDFPTEKIALDQPPDEKMGDYALACFDLAKELGQNPAAVAKKLAAGFKTSPLVSRVAPLGPYLNLFIQADNFIPKTLLEIDQAKNFGQNMIGKNKKLLLEFSGPNTNKPQHIGHLRNNVLGQTLSNILKICDFKVVPINIINDRGIHIMKSMLAWQKFGQGETPQSSGLKGDHLVGKYYVKFGQLLAQEKKEYLAKNKIDLTKLNNLEKKKSEEKFLKKSQWMQKAQAMLQAWENNDPEVKKLWKTMNNWVYQGYDETYKKLGIEFDKVYYESQTYLLGKGLVKLGLKKKVFYQKKDGSIWIDLTKDGLDQKIILRSDGTSVYITQDLGTAKDRYDQFKFDQMIYVVASEQDYHFKVLFLILKKLGFKWADHLYHLSYGMVNLPEGKIKSREGTVIDADDLIKEMENKALETMSQATKQFKVDQKQKNQIAEIVGLGALKFFLLGANPQKTITFNPKESISFDGYTGPFIQYTHARISNILKKSPKIKKIKTLDFNLEFNNEELKLTKLLLDFPETIQKTAQNYNPSVLTQYLFELAKAFNNFYQHHSVLKADTENLKQIRLHLCQQTKKILAKGLKLMSIESPEVM
ncbi:MAG: arginine--tRNA ligase [Candidatus Komeilibacteria bacterium CG11_big_fil_rev_8_21_14_0_20_36_20]|uniref:Arginine--tRNA ligase n=1 Tax=Candidatus Komeilibacteria bacterium CG11_big_fil_rev_8_21_14_0_20_36_20 TaxID=1974477 RepID=A0A2H0NEC3_9BACT|nr:MAG: arginine--tRNA ligase [Candidatus Komeilibacteria bacterium CG11_big_fil_rev_8_21_14_0_20_36_20]PIR81692.1 MAG: arginine--tRNA ligase [Candidatus Komeilibacteria bacterium CG10_big_fil_rev_8_21_14_0_10_36_65]PJC55623.1 MAG: arginine--tRNA ligase [Candidatus Komeilibacteria bacterium CG_4_9_14_0_2_um_filter_36_13]